MNSLDVTRINIYAPYKVWSNGEIYRFETDNGIKYLVDSNWIAIRTTLLSGLT
jgi:hypothetical protein